MCGIFVELEAAVFCHTICHSVSAFVDSGISTAASALLFVPPLPRLWYIYTEVRII